MKSLFPLLTALLLVPVALHGGDKPTTDVAEKRANQSDPSDKKADGRLTTDRVSPERHKQTHPALSGESSVDPEGAPAKL